MFTYQVSLNNAVNSYFGFTPMIELSNKKQDLLSSKITLLLNKGIVIPLLDGRHGHFYHWEWMIFLA